MAVYRAFAVCLACLPCAAGFSPRLTLYHGNTALWHHGKTYQLGRLIFGSNIVSRARQLRDVRFSPLYTHQHSRFMAAARLVQPASRYSRKQIRRNRPHVTPRTFFAREMYIIYAGGQRGSERPLIGLAAWLTNYIHIGFDSNKIYAWQVHISMLYLH